jgi:hypothetical protein
MSHDGFQAGLTPGDRQPARCGPGLARTMTASDVPFSQHRATARSAPRASNGLRLRRRDPSAADGFVDGGWWPRSLDLSAELPELLAALSSAGHDVARVAYNPSAWDPAPDTLAAPGRPVAFDERTDQDAALISLVDISGAKRTDLVVVPPHTGRRVAERVLTLAGLGGDLRRAVGILERANREWASALGHTAPVVPLSAAARETDTGPAPAL